MQSAAQVCRARMKPAGKPSVKSRTAQIHCADGNRPPDCVKPDERTERACCIPNLLATLDLTKSPSYTRPSFMKLSSLPGWTLWLIFVGLFAPAEAKSEPVMVNGIAARVNDAIITFQQIEGEMDEPERLLRSQLRNQPEVLKQRITDLRNNTVELLIERLLILDDFNNNPNYKLPESVVEDVIRRRIRDKF